MLKNDRPEVELTIEYVELTPEYVELTPEYVELTPEYVHRSMEEIAKRKRQVSASDIARTAEEIPIVKELMSQYTPRELENGKLSLENGKLEKRGDNVYVLIQDFKQVSIDRYGVPHNSRKECLEVNNEWLKDNKRI